MDIATLDEIIKQARAAKSCRQKLDRLHDAQIKRMHNGSMSRALTTTYNANAAWAAEAARDHEQNLRKLIGLPPEASAPVSGSSEAAAVAASESTMSFPMDLRSSFGAIALQGGGA